MIESWIPESGYCLKKWYCAEPGILGITQDEVCVYSISNKIYIYNLYGIFKRKIDVPNLGSNCISFSTAISSESEIFILVGEISSLKQKIIKLSSCTDTIKIINQWEICDKERRGIHMLEDGGLLYVLEYSTTHQFPLKVFRADNGSYLCQIRIQCKPKARENFFGGFFYGSTCVGFQGMCLSKGSATKQAFVLDSSKNAIHVVKLNLKKI